MIPSGKTGRIEPETLFQRWLRIESAPQTERVAAYRTEDHPDPGVELPDGSFRRICAILAGDAVHDAGDALEIRFFLQAYIAVSFEDDDVSFSTYDSMDQDITSDVTHEGHCAFAYVTVSPWPEGDLVPQMHQERVHAVAFDRKGYGFALSNEFADFLIHHLLVDGYFS